MQITLEDFIAASKLKLFESKPASLRSNLVNVETFNDL